MSKRKPCKSCGNLGVTYEVEPTYHPDFERVFSFCPECGRTRGNWVRSNTDRKGHPRTVAVPVDGVARTVIGSLDMAADELEGLAAGTEGEVSPAAHTRILEQRTALRSLAEDFRASIADKGENE